MDIQVHQTPCDFEALAIAPSFSSCGFSPASAVPFLSYD
jgi:hypothetical protein